MLSAQTAEELTYCSTEEFIFTIYDAMELAQNRPDFQEIVLQLNEAGATFNSKFCDRKRP